MFPSTTKTVQLRKGMGTSKIGVGKIRMFTLAFEVSQFWSLRLTLPHLLCSRDTCSMCSWGRCAPSCLPDLLQGLEPSWSTISSLSLWIRGPPFFGSLASSASSRDLFEQPPALTLSLLVSLLVTLVHPGTLMPYAEHTPSERLCSGGGVSLASVFILAWFLSQGKDLCRSYRGFAP